MPTATTPTTARALLASVRPLGPVVEGDELVFDADPAADLEPVLRVLHTGLRAVLAGKRWYGCGGGTGRVVELSPAAPIPTGITLLCVEGDQRWDRIPVAARSDCRDLFADGKPTVR